MEDEAIIEGQQRVLDAASRGVGKVRSPIRGK
jgi:hypothetical protein